jgi:hypothetical protein
VTRLDAIPSISHSILDGSAILFVGAGVSFLSKNKNGDTLPNGDKLKEQLHIETKTRKPFTLEKISSFYVRKLGSAKLYDYLVDTLSVYQVAKELVDFYKLPWRRIYTTNYDNAIEFSRQSTRGRASYNRHYPFKAGRALSSLAAKHYDHWSHADQQSFIGGCRTLLRKAQEWQAKNKSSNDDVSMMIRETIMILKRIGPSEIHS